MPFFEFPIALVELFLLVLMRIMGLLLAAPLFSSRATPLRWKVSLGIILTLTVIPLLPVDHLPAGPHSIYSWVGMAFHEVFLGIFLGAVVQILFWAAQFGGQLVGVQMGFGVVAVLDPESGSQQGLISQLMRWALLIVFLALDGHHMLLSALFESFQRLPIGGVHLSGLLQDDAIRMTGDVLILGLRMGAPVLAALFLTEVGLGVVARTVPQMNIFIVGFPLKIGVGMVMLGLLMAPFAIFVGDQIPHWAQQLDALFTRFL